VAIFAAGASTAQLAQQPQGQPPQAPRVRANPDPNCTATPAQLEANKQLVMNPVGNPNDRIDPSYKQHNPAFIKGGRDAGMTDYAYFMSRFGGPGRAGGGGPQGGPGGRGPATGPQPPAGDPFDIVVAECDIVATFHMNYRQDPTAAPGTWYQAFTFDTWRVRTGKIVEHWDNAVINPPTPPPAAQ
jgi:predicted SnoaL-like aldol condensation-catalyzing enzyme